MPLRCSQVVPEILVASTTAAVRDAQLVPEVLYASTAAAVIDAQLVPELLIVAPVNLRAAQIPVEVLFEPVAVAPGGPRMSQLAVETLFTPDTTGSGTQVLITFDCAAEFEHPVISRRRSVVTPSEEGFVQSEQQWTRELRTFQLRWKHAREGDVW